MAKTKRELEKEKKIRDIGAKTQKTMSETLESLLQETENANSTYRPIKSLNPNSFISGKRMDQSNYLAAVTGAYTKKLYERYLKELKISKKAEKKGKKESISKERDVKKKDQAKQAKLDSRSSEQMERIANSNERQEKNQQITMTSEQKKTAALEKKSDIAKKDIIKRAKLQEDALEKMENERIKDSKTFKGLILTSVKDSSNSLINSFASNFGVVGDALLESTKTRMSDNKEQKKNDEKARIENNRLLEEQKVALMDMAIEIKKGGNENRTHLDKIIVGVVDDFSNNIFNIPDVMMKNLTTVMKETSKLDDKFISEHFTSIEELSKKSEKDWNELERIAASLYEDLNESLNKSLLSIISKTDGDQINLKDAIDGIKISAEDSNKESIKATKETTEATKEQTKVQRESSKKSHKASVQVAKAIETQTQVQKETAVDLNINSKDIKSTETVARNKMEERDQSRWGITKAFYSKMLKFNSMAGSLGKVGGKKEESGWLSDILTTGLGMMFGKKLTSFGIKMLKGMGGMFGKLAGVIMMAGGAAKGFLGGRNRGGRNRPRRAGGSKFGKILNFAMLGATAATMLPSSGGGPEGGTDDWGFGNVFDSHEQANTAVPKQKDNTSYSQALQEVTTNNMPGYAAETALIHGAGPLAKTVAPKISGKVMAKLGGKALAKGGAKKIPFFGLFAGGAFAADRAMEGDWWGATQEMASGLLGATGLGIPLSLAIDANLLKNDIDAENDKLAEKTIKSGLIEVGKVKAKATKKIIENVVDVEKKGITGMMISPFIQEGSSNYSTKTNKVMSFPQLQSQQDLRKSNFNGNGTPILSVRPNSIAKSNKIGVSGVSTSNSMNNRISSNIDWFATGTSSLSVHGEGPSREETQLKVLAQLTKMNLILANKTSKLKIKNNKERLMTNSEFGVGEDFPDEKPKEKSMWQTIKDSVGSLFGISPSSGGSGYSHPSPSSPSGPKSPSSPVANHDGGGGTATMTKTKNGREIHYANGDTKFGGHRNWRNNNPGNLEYNDYTKGLGAVGGDDRFAIFPSMDAGYKAQGHMLTKGKNYKNLTLSDAIKRYAPKHENDTNGYINQVVKNSGVGSNVIMGQMSEAQALAVVKAMAQHEGMKVGTLVKGGQSSSVGSVAASGKYGSGYKFPKLTAQSDQRSVGNFRPTTMPTKAQYRGSSSVGAGGSNISGSSNLVDNARSYVGGNLTYSQKGSRTADSGSMDCSSWVAKMVRDTFGIPTNEFGGSTNPQFRYLSQNGEAINPGSEQAGDFACYGDSGTSSRHIAIVSGNGMQIHMSSSKNVNNGQGGVRESAIQYNSSRGLRIYRLNNSGQSSKAPASSMSAVAQAGTQQSAGGMGSGGASMTSSVSTGSSVAMGGSGVQSGNNTLAGLGGGIVKSLLGGSGAGDALNRLIGAKGSSNNALNILPSILGSSMGNIASSIGNLGSSYGAEEKHTIQSRVESDSMRMLQGLFIGRG